MTRLQAIAYYQSEATDARRNANDLQWQDRSLAVEWLAYALQCERQARQLEFVASGDYYRDLWSATQAIAIPLPVQLALIEE